MADCGFTHERPEELVAELVARCDVVAVEVDLNSRVQFASPAATTQKRVSQIC